MSDAGRTRRAMDHTLSYRRSINFKLGRLVLIAVGIGLALVAGLGVWHETGRYTASKREALLAAAQVFGAASSRALANGDVNAVLQAMRAVGKVPGVVFAMVEDRTGAPIADLGSAVRLEGDLNLDAGQEVSLWRLLSSRTVQVSIPVVDAGEPVGRFIVVSDTNDLFGRFRDLLLTSVTGAALAMAIGLMISFRLQRSITAPLVALTRTMAAVRESHDYRATVEVKSDDEIGILASSFNGMIGEIRERDHRPWPRSKSEFLATNEPRDPHADERHAGHGRAPGVGGSAGPAAALRRGHRPLGPEPACEHQRHPGLRQGRVGQARARAHRRRPGRGRRHRRDAVRRARAVEGARPRGRGRARGAGRDHRRSRAPDAGAEQSRQQRTQVQRARTCAAEGRARAGR